MKKLLFAALLDRIAGIRDADGKPVFRWVDRWFNQAANIEREEYDLPAAFVHFGDWQWQTLGQGIQRATANVTVYVMQSTAAENFRAVTKQGTVNVSDNADWAMKLFDAEDAVQRSLHGWSPNLPEPLSAGVMTRTASSSNADYTDVTVDALSFTVEVTDAAAAPDRALATVEDVFPVTDMNGNPFPMETPMPVPGGFVLPRSV